METHYPIFNYFFGIVEDRNDPEKLGRVRVRIFGYHTNDIALIPTSDLPWSGVIQPITSASMNGIGQSPTGIIEGTHVLGFFKDGETCQDPVILGTIGGFPPSKTPDNNVKLPQITSIFKSNKYPLVKGEPDTNRLAINDPNKQHKIIAEKIANEDKNVSIANSDLTWSEPNNPYNTIYPFNEVKETESGHIKEYDNTPSHERIHEYHTSGTFREVHSNGDIVTKIVGDGYLIVQKGKNVHIKGSANVTIEGNINLKVVGNLEIQVDGNVNGKNSGTYTWESAQGITFKSNSIDFIKI